MAAAASNDLSKIAMEGFALLDESVVVVGRKARRPLLYQQPPHVQSSTGKHDQFYPGYNDHSAIDCYQAARKYGGVVIADYKLKKLPVVKRRFPLGL